MRVQQPHGYLFDDEGEAPKRSPEEQLLAQDLERSLSDAKATGNNLFQEGRYDDACAAYKHGLDLFEGSGGHRPGRHVSSEVRKLAIALYCNAAQGQLKSTGVPAACASRARAMADRALSLEPLNVKALFRRGQAFAFGEDWDRAIRDFELVLEREPGSDAARSELERVQEKRRVPGTAVAKASLSASLREKLEDAVADGEDSKAKGTRLFTEGKYYQAYEVWLEAIDALGDFPQEELTAEAQRLLVALCNNATQALLSCPEVDGSATTLAAAMADRALALEPSNIKALFRRGLARANAEEWHLANQDFEHVLDLEPGHASAREELEKLKASGVLAPPGVEEEAKPDLSDPAVAAKMAQKEADRLKREILARADGQGGAPKWSRRFNKAQVRAAAWARHQLSNEEGLQELIAVRGPVFAEMDEQQREDFIAACEFMSEMRAQFGGEIDELLRAGG